MKTHLLTEKQKTFFLRQKLVMNASMQGALQLLIEEMGLTGRVRLSDDCSELIEEENENPPAPAI